MTTLTEAVTPEMFKAAAPWLTNWQHMNRATREANFEEAYKAARRVALIAEPAAPQAEPSDADIEPGIRAFYGCEGSFTESLRAALLALRPAPVAEPATPGRSVRIDFRQATDLLAMFGGEAAEITLASGSGNHTEHSGPGLYAWYTDYPEEGSIHLGVTDEEAEPEQAARSLTADERAVIREAIKDSAEIVAPGRLVEPAVSGVEDASTNDDLWSAYAALYGSGTKHWAVFKSGADHIRNHLVAAAPPQPVAQSTMVAADAYNRKLRSQLEAEWAALDSLKRAWQPVAQGDRPAQPTSDGRRAAAVFYSRIERTEEGLPVMTDCSVAGPWNARIEFDAGERAASRIMDSETFFDTDRAARSKREGHMVAAAQAALDAYEDRFESTTDKPNTNYIGPIDDEMKALRSALAAAPSTNGGDHGRS